MKKVTRFLMISGVVSGVGIFASPSVLAACTATGTNIICDGSTVGVQHFNETGQNITVQSGAQVSTSADNLLSTIDFSSEQGLLTNAGTITSFGNNTHAVRVRSIDARKMINNGTVSTTGDGSHAVKLSELGGSTVQNSGLLLTSGTASYGVHATEGSQRNTVINTGRIVTTGAGSHGMVADNSRNNTLNNSGNIVVNGSGSSGIFVGQYAKDYQIENQASGVINATAGNGISVTGNSTVTSITNSGIVEGEVNGLYLSDTAQVGSIINSGFIVGNSAGVVFADNSNTNLFINRGVIGSINGDAIRAENNINITNGINNQGVIIGRVNAPGSNMSNSGIFDLLNNNAPSSVNNYTQTSSGVLALQADDTSNYGKLQVAGNATLNGRTIVVTNGSTSFKDGDYLRDVVTASNISGTPYAVLDDSLRYQFVQEQTSTSYSLKIVETKLTTVKNAISTASNNTSLTALGGTIDTLINTNNTSTTTPTTLNCNGALASTVCAVTSSSTAAQVHKNVVQLAPLMDGSMPYIELNNLRAFGNIVGDRQESVRGQGYDSEFNPEKYLWIRPVGRWDNQSSRGDYTGYNADTRGIAIGADGLVIDQTRLGLALGMSRTDVNDTSSDIRHDARVESWNALAYGGYDFTPDTSLTWQTGFGRNTTQGNRYLNIENPADGSTAFSGTAHSDYDSHTFQAGLGLQSTFHPAESWTLTPVLRSDYYRVKNKGYKESGADDVGLDVDGTTTEAWVFSGKAKAGLQLSEIVDVHGYLGAGYDVKNDPTQTTAAFIGSQTTPFTYKGMNESPWIAMAGVGVTAKFSDVLDGTVQYDAEQRTKFTSQSVSMKVRYAF